MYWGSGGEAIKNFETNEKILSMDSMLNNVVEQLLLFSDVIWYCGCVRQCPSNRKMHTYVFRGEAS